MNDREELVKILQFNMMRGVQEGKKETKNGQVLLSGQREYPLPGRYMIVEADSSGKITAFKKACMVDVRTTAVVEQEGETKVQKWSL